MGQFKLTEDATAPMSHGRVVFCPDEPLCLEDAAPILDSERWLPNSPFSSNEDGHAGFTVLNTFIHEAPKPSASRRSKSLPKDLGSEKNTWEATRFDDMDAACGLMSPSP